MNSWSYSRYLDFKTCKFMAWLKYDQRIPEPPRPLPAGKTEHANDRGTRIHTSCEEFITGASNTLTAEAAKFFEPQITLLRHLHTKGEVSVEGEWAMDRQWDPIDWHGQWTEEPDAPTTKTVRKLPEYGVLTDVLKCAGKTYAWQPSWLRLKLDAIVHHSPVQATVIDFKSGKKFGNEIKHGEQLQLYQLVSLLRFPKLERVHAELWYLDQNEVTRVTFTRTQGMQFLRGFDNKGHSITDCTDWPANPSLMNCRFCPYGERPDGAGTGHCKKGVYK